MRQCLWAPSRERTCLSTVQKPIDAMVSDPWPLFPDQKAASAPTFPYMRKGTQGLVNPRMSRAVSLSKVLKKGTWLLVELCQVPGPQE